jgi:gluconate 2-dehydrogenase alpha chain
MADMKALKPVDVTIAGGGWSGLLIAKELATRTSLEVVVLERGPARGMKEYVQGMDEVDYVLRNKMMQNPAELTITHRHSVGDRAAPIRQYGAFKPGTGTGGSGEHWGGISDRYLEDFFILESRLKEKYGAGRLPPDLSVQDWGVTYPDLEDYYWRAEQLLGVSGKAGNLRGEKIAGGNIFEAPRRHEYPTPPLTATYSMTFLYQAATELGYHPYPLPASNLSRTYTNPDGVSRPGCVYCGYCPSFGCMIGAKAQPTNVLLPVLRSRKNFTLRNNCCVRRVVHRSGKAQGVMYMDENGEETFQPASLVILTAWTPQNTRLLMLSRIGEQYDAATGKGTLGRNLTHQVTAGAHSSVVFKEPLNAFMTSGAVGYGIADFDGDERLDASDGLLRGGTFSRGASPEYLPISTFGRIPSGEAPRNWGSEWKKASIRLWDHVGSAAGYRGDHFAYRQNFMDLDPTYTDRWGDPLLRMTLDWTDYEYRQMQFGSRIATQLDAAVAKAAGGKLVEFAGRHSQAIQFAHTPGKRPRYNASAYSTTHIQGGAIMGVSPERGVVNTWLQHWNMPNLFVVGSSSFPQNSSGNPTLTILAVTLRAADGIVERYLKHPESLI